MRQNQDHPANSSYQTVTDCLVTLPHDTPQEQVKRFKQCLKAKESLWKQSAIVILQGQDAISMRIERTAFPIFYLSSLYTTQGRGKIYKQAEQHGFSHHVVGNIDQLTPLTPT